MTFMDNCKFENMKRGTIFFMVMVIFPLLPVTAQNPNFEKLNAYKIAFFTRKLNLTSQEAEKFWPVYNDFQNKRNSIQLERQSLNRYINQNELNMPEKEMIEAGDKYISLQVQEVALAQEFHNKFKEILSPVKIIRLYQAENQYKVQLLKELQDQQPLRKNIQRGPGRNPL
jgi:hypothetical protein